MPFSYQKLHSNCCDGQPCRWHKGDNCSKATSSMCLVCFASFYIVLVCLRSCFTFWRSILNPFASTTATLTKVWDQGRRWWWSRWTRSAWNRGQWRCGLWKQKLGGLSTPYSNNSRIKFQSLIILFFNDFIIKCRWSGWKWWWRKEWCRVGRAHSQGFQPWHPMQIDGEGQRIEGVCDF